MNTMCSKEMKRMATLTKSTSFPQSTQKINKKHIHVKNTMSLHKDEDFYFNQYFNNPLRKNIKNQEEILLRTMFSQNNKNEYVPYKLKSS